jgi:hypothetical protein
MQVHAGSSAHTSWTSAGLPPRARITTVSRRRAHGGRAYAKAAVAGPVAGTAQAGIAARLGRLVLKSLAAHWFAPLQPTGGGLPTGLRAVCQQMSWFHPIARRHLGDQLASRKPLTAWR